MEVERKTSGQLKATECTQCLRAVLPHSKRQKRGSNWSDPRSTLAAKPLDPQKEAALQCIPQAEGKVPSTGLTTCSGRGMSKSLNDLERKISLPFFLPQTQHCCRRIHSRSGSVQNTTAAPHRLTASTAAAAEGHQKGAPNSPNDCGDSWAQSTSLELSDVHHLRNVLQRGFSQGGAHSFKKRKADKEKGK